MKKKTRFHDRTRSGPLARVVKDGRRKRTGLRAFPRFDSASSRPDSAGLATVNAHIWAFSDRRNHADHFDGWDGSIRQSCEILHNFKEIKLIFLHNKFKIDAHPASRYIGHMISFLLIPNM